jgi:hypothetical protein
VTMTKKTGDMNTPDNGSDTTQNKQMSAFIKKGRSVEFLAFRSGWRDYPGSGSTSYP